MIIYQEDLGTFVQHCKNGNIENEISQRMGFHGIFNGNKSMRNSWTNSLPQMAHILEKANLNKQLDVAIEYRIATSCKQVDFMIYGDNVDNKPQIIIIELKQWSEVKDSVKENFVYTNPHHNEWADCWHPSIQAFNYANIIRNFNEYVQKHDVGIKACSYLHNLENLYDITIKNIDKFPLIEIVPTFLKNDIDLMRHFVQNNIQKPNKQLLYSVDNSKIKPSKQLQTMLSSALKGNGYDTLDDDQAYAIASIVQHATSNINSERRATIIIRGGPGTGKSVVAINALGRIISKYGLNACYVTKNSAPRVLFRKELISSNDRSLMNLFKSPVAFTRSGEMSYDCLIVDEAHRIVKMSNYPIYVEDSLNDIFKASRVNVFFIDEEQQVTTKDYCTIDLIKKYALKWNSKVIDEDSLKLSSQFRCLGGVEYISMIRTFLGYEKSLSKFQSPNFQFKVYDSISKMKSDLKILDDKFSKVRIVSGFTHDWASRKNPDVNDFVMEDGAFKAKWNLGNKGADYSWVGDASSFNEIGCIHTCQGIDLNYCGVIIGKDMIYRDGKIVFCPAAMSSDDKSSGIKNCGSESLAAKLIRNTYQVLLTRGMRGCFVYCEDSALNAYLKTFIA